MVSFCNKHLLMVGQGLTSGHLLGIKVCANFCVVQFASNSCTVNILTENYVFCWPTLAACTRMHNLQAVLVYNCLHGTAPRYLWDVIQPVAVTSRSTSLSALVVMATRRTAIGDRAFAVAGPRAWNSLPQFVTDYTSSDTLENISRHYLFSISLQSTEQQPTNIVKHLPL